MIEKVQSIPHWSDEEHRTVPAHPGLRGKWITFQDLVFWQASHVSEWDRLFIGVRIESQPKCPASDDELFQQATAKVNHKVQIDRKILGGAPCIAGTRIPVYAILQLVEADYSHKRILKSFPSLSREELAAALRFSAIVMER